jgi:hypothetical protein
VHATQLSLVLWYRVNRVLLVRAVSVQAMLQVRSLRHLSGLVQLQELLVKPRGYIK